MGMNNTKALCFVLLIALSTLQYWPCHASEGHIGVEEGGIRHMCRYMLGGNTTTERCRELCLALGSIYNADLSYLQFCDKRYTCQCCCKMY
uniref:Knottin scorpion toxin-like domain-containing protein n=2 Tax=Aegilops tauschii TaxID=37682 RepID=A0A453NK35_AEGTS